MANRSIDDLYTSDDHRKECAEWLTIARRDISAKDETLALLHAQAHATLAVSLELSALVEMFYARG